MRPPRDATRTARLGRRRLVWPNASIRSKPTWAEPERITVSRHAHAVQDEARVSDWHGGGGLGLGGTTATCVSLALTSSLVTAAALPPLRGPPPSRGSRRRDGPSRVPRRVGHKPSPPPRRAEMGVGLGGGGSPPPPNTLSSRAPFARRSLWLGARVAGRTGSSAHASELSGPGRHC